MSRSQFNITALAPLLIGFTLVNSAASGQTAIAIDPPTLKIRQRESRHSSAPSPSDQQPSQNEKSGDTDLIANQLNACKVRFEGLHAFTVDEAIKLLRERRVSLPSGYILAPEVLAGAVTVLQESLEARGYMQAVVEARQDDEANTMVFLVSEGPRFPIAEIRFEGNRILSSQELSARMREFLSRHEESRTGYDAEIFEYHLRQLNNLIRSKGYLHARFHEPKRAIIEGALVITVPIEEGALYRLGEIKIEGAENLSPELLRGMLRLQREDIADGEAIGKWLFDDVRKLYAEMGYIEYTAEPDPVFREVDLASNEAVVDFRVYIEEGRQFRLHAIKFEGGNASERDLRNLLLIRAGDVFNQELFEKSVNELNKTGWFEIIDKDKDADYRMDQEAALLDITIRLKRVERPQTISW